MVIGKIDLRHIEVSAKFATYTQRGDIETIDNNTDRRLSIDGLNAVRLSTRAIVQVLTHTRIDPAPPPRTPG
jgi:hypothetical protein